MPIFQHNTHAGFRLFSAFHRFDSNYLSLYSNLNTFQLFFGKKNGTFVQPYNQVCIWLLVIQSFCTKYHFTFLQSLSSSLFVQSPCWILVFLKLRSHQNMIKAPFKLIKLSSIEKYIIWFFIFPFDQPLTCLIKFPTNSC